MTAMLPGIYTKQQEKKNVKDFYSVMISISSQDEKLNLKAYTHTQVYTTTTTTTTTTHYPNRVQ